MKNKFLPSNPWGLILFLFVFVFASCDDDDGTNQGVIENPLAVEFSASAMFLEVSTTNLSMNGRTYAWDFGAEGLEDNTSIQFEPSFTYEVPGTYTISLTVRGDEGQVDTFSSDITVAEEPIIPTATFTSTVDGLMATFTNTSENAASFAWDFGDGMGTSTDENPTYVYGESGTFTVGLTTTSLTGNTAESTASVTVEAPAGPGNPGNQLALITDTSADDTGELRLELDASIAMGMMTVTVNKAMTQDGFVNLSGSSTSRSNAMIDMRINNTEGYEFTESGDSVNASANFPAFVNDQFVEMVITWDATGAGAPLITVTIDGQAVTAAAFPTEAGDLSTVQDGVRNVQFRLGGGSGLDDTGAGFFVDDLRIYDTSSGSPMLVFGDDFESYTVGNSLDPNADTASSGPIPDAIIAPDTPYRNNSFQVTVAVEE